jgi:hypothetical protein
LSAPKTAARLPKRASNAFASGLVSPRGREHQELEQFIIRERRRPGREQPFAHPLAMA